MIRNIIERIKDWWWLRKMKPIYIDYIPEKKEPEEEVRRWKMLPYVMNGKLYDNRKEVRLEWGRLPQCKEKEK